MELRAAGLSFVAAPVASVSGRPAERIDERHSVSVFAHVDGAPGQWGRPVGAEARRELVTMLARLHGVPAAARGLACRGLELPGRAGFEAALDDLGRSWDGGPLSEPARRALAGHRHLVTRWLADLDRAAARLGDDDAPAVVTHGEPHPGNLIGTGTGFALVDWDTVALARPERDLWMIAGADPTAVSAYRDLTGVTPEAELLAAYRLLWGLSDLVAYTAQLRGGHRRNADADRALAAVRSVLDGREPAPYGAAPPT
jgi:spectinomycin phosphotransferase